MAQTVKNLPASLETQIRSLGWEDPLEKRMATHYSILAWRIPRIEEPGRLHFMASQRVGHRSDFHFTLNFPLLYKKNSTYQLSDGITAQILMTEIIPQF